MKKSILFYAFLSILISSCTVVKPYQKVYLNDADMKLNSSSGELFENYVHSIRGGSTSAGESKSGDGCGCN